MNSLSEALHFEFAWPYMNSLSAAGQSRERSQIARSLQAGHFYVAPYEQFISGWPSQERSQLTRSSHFELGLPFLTFRHMNKFISDRQNPEENQMTRSLHFKPGWPFLHCAIRTVYQRLAKPRKANQAQKGANDQICTFQAKLAILTLRHMNSLSAAGQAQKKRSCKFEARLSDFEEKRSKLLSWPAQGQGNS